ncbi:inorganic phosphate transporter [Maribellus sp. CM-23]|uniref:inorganic phosphate transporter n=1 Tax=Maribellus sp. CM-23 TaxID=2781026 RepID=UPI001F22162A|nr:inorganic phosphate transporter [Maribellus sp. CM-23]MCE4563690.1 inorganic phosphate transporter [Maribellus sp. CM-23]
MENFYLVLVVILFALAISDLIVGVSNDAVNFLNSAVGSKAAPKWVIFLMASLGVLIGAAFSNGMMEVARKGIFHPDQFYFSEIMVIFLAVMITDVILLDMFNTFGMPTSTTVSIVFELLGAAVATAIVKIKMTGGTVLLELSNYINSGQALGIISGILLSVFVAFTVGAIVMYFARMLFSFEYGKSIKYFGSAFGGLAITAITYFMLIKGIKGSAFADIPLPSGESLSNWIKHHTFTVLLLSFAGWTVLIQLLSWIFKIDILKVVVLAGTFALAMAFAGNDLVNFIGVPIAGFKSFEAWRAAGGIAPDAFSMEILKEKSATPIYMLLISGLVMVATLILSKKAQAVTETEVNLGRQTEGMERFGSSLVARLMVRHSIRFNKSIGRVIPSTVTSQIQKRFVPVSLGPADDPRTPAFDKVRASVNLVVASILIALATSMKLPLSTTYVTFMVAMGTSLSDRAWDRESAVYRVSGVFAVIGGWFLTALIAFTVSALIATIISVGGKFMIFVFIAIAIFMVVRTQLLFKKRSAKKLAEEVEAFEEKDGVEKVVQKCRKHCVNAIETSNKIFSVGVGGFLAEDRAQLREALQLKNELNVKSKKVKAKIFSTLSKIEDQADYGHHYVQVVDYQREIANSLNFLIQPLFEHMENQHKPFTDEQAGELRKLMTNIDKYLDLALLVVTKNKFDEIDNLTSMRDRIIEQLQKTEKAQIKRIKTKEVNTRNSVLYFNVNSETKNVLLRTISMVKAYRDFVQVTQPKK